MSDDDPTDEAIKRVDLHVDPDWKSAAYDSLERVARCQVTFTTDNVWATLRRVYPGATTHEHRAMGAIVTKARADGIIEPVGEYRISERAVCHRNPKRVWRSLIYSKS